MKRKEGGFTIVEVVIAVTVISVLLIIAMTTFNGLTAKGRDATRRARAEAMALDLERYYKYNTTSRGHEYPTGNALLADISKYFSITYRQLDYWAHTGLVEPSMRFLLCAPSFHACYAFCYFRHQHLVQAEPGPPASGPAGTDAPVLRAGFAAQHTAL